MRGLPDERRGLENNFSMIRFMIRAIWSLFWGLFWTLALSFALMVGILFFSGKTGKGMDGVQSGCRDGC